jgi:hypothetical protein
MASCDGQGEQRQINRSRFQTGSRARRCGFELTSRARCANFGVRKKLPAPYS